MIFPPGMTSRGKHIAFVVAIVILFFLPKNVECGYPDGQCGHFGMFKQVCKSWELEPLGLYAIEKLAGRNVGFAYSSGEDCH